MSSKQKERKRSGNDVLRDWNQPTTRIKISTSTTAKGICGRDQI
ncbi:MAG: hypothetical protein PHS17_18235 [Desulfobacterales bacterium]|nr:hypothetical protein [Desulfobacterales bacterium]